MLNAILYLAAFALLLASYVKDKKKTRTALLKAWKSFENLLPQFLVILLVIGILLAAVSPETITLVLGQNTGWVGMGMAALIGSVTLIPGFVAFPLTAALYENGGGLMQLAVFVSTLMGVGVVTLPVEMGIFGLRVSLARNFLNLLLAFGVAAIMGVVLT
ncbi:permease [Desulfoluna spongiiphila]|uniref:Permease n=1 Tax=Desulfoluna spongiiphila TaxID=419481 RepID=A0A1G5HHL7_9BACT|nr:permease [Desulfoluna spongiiphila]SCY63276.1 hypothetical protein SAMN05216233_11450 [Desulfoluna spongiiphila]